MDLIEGKEINVQLTRVPIYEHHGYVPSWHETKRTLIVDEVIDHRSCRVTVKGVTRKLGTLKLKMRGRLVLGDLFTAGMLFTANANYEVAF